MNLSTEEGNKLISVFDGWIQDDNIKDKPFWHPERNMTQYTYPDSFKYHTSWSWVMPVLERIGKLSPFALTESGIRISDAGIVVKNKPTLIETVWEAVVLYTQWYNKNNEL